MCIEIVGSCKSLPPLPTRGITGGVDATVGERGQNLTATDFSDARTRSVTPPRNRSKSGSILRYLLRKLSGYGEGRPCQPVKLQLNHRSPRRPELVRGTDLYLGQLKRKPYFADQLCEESHEPPDASTPPAQTSFEEPGNIHGADEELKAVLKRNRIVSSCSR